MRGGGRVGEKYYIFLLAVVAFGAVHIMMGRKKLRKTLFGALKIVKGKDLES